jgi:hypothetical protein
MRFLLTFIVFQFLIIGSVHVSCAQSQPDSQTQAQPQQGSSQNQAQSQTTPAPQDQQTTPSQPNVAPGSATSAQQPSQGATPSQAPNDADHPVLKRRPAKKPLHKKKPAKTTSGKVIVRNGGATEGTPQLSPGISQEQAAHNRDNTEQLLATTDANLKSVAGRQLTPAQQSMVEQIHAYVTQSKAAADAGDLGRAHTLAFKAHLLSDELAKK